MVMAPRWRGVLILAGVFSLGAISGAGVVYAVFQQRLAALLSEDRSEARDQRRLEAFTRELDLDAGQREQVQRIAERYRPERDKQARAMFESCGAPLLGVKDRMDGEIRALLRPEQQQAFDAMRERRQRAFSRTK